MSPSWPSRLLSGPTTPTGDPEPTTTSKPTTRTPLTVESPSDASSSRTPSHNRSSSHPLPRIFKRRGSSGWGKQPGLEEDLVEGNVPVVDSRHGTSPVKASIVKRKMDGEAFQTRLCMCCGHKVKIPADLNVFRCTNCLTVNDLIPYRPQFRDSNKAPPGTTDGQDGNQSQLLPVTRPILPLSVERTRAIIDHCLTVYLELKFRDQPHDSPGADQSYFSQSSGMTARPTLPPRISSDDIGPRSPLDEHPPSRYGTAPNTPEETPSASIKSSADIDWRTYEPTAEHTSNGRESEESNSLRPQLSIRHPAPQHPGRRPPPPPAVHGPAAATRSSMATRPKPQTLSSSFSSSSPAVPEQRLPTERYERAKRIFRPLEEYMHHNYGRFESLNGSFSTFRPRVTGRTHSESALRTPPPEPMDGSTPLKPEESYPQIDAKTLLLGDFAENGDWWTGRLERNTSERVDRKKDKGSEKRRGINSKSPCMDWTRLDKWYEAVRTPDRNWLDRWKQVSLTGDSEDKALKMDPKLRAEIQLDMSIAREHTEKTLFKLTEQLLRRPGRLLTEPEDLRFLIIILSNELLYPKHIRDRRMLASRQQDPQIPRFPIKRSNTSAKQGQDPGQHAGILKRSFGLLAGSSDTCHRYLIAWFSRLPEGRYLDLLDLVSSFVSYRLSRRRPAKPKITANPVDNSGLIPDLSGSAMYTSTQLQTAAGLSGGLKSQDDKDAGNLDYPDDWQLRAAAKVMALLFAANNDWPKAERNQESQGNDLQSIDHRPRSHLNGQLLPVSDFYSSILDYQDVIADFKAWESKSGKFSFCQYPFFLSLGAKIRILEYDARRQMEIKARETYFNNVISGRSQDVNFHLHVRRECVVEDSLQRISEAVGQLQGDLKKGLKVHFAGEEGVDAGGLRKEWFLLLVRDIFDPNHGLFLYDEDSHLCYFNPNSFETSDQYYMVGVLLGLAIYNSTILDIALPSFAFRRLLASAPATTTQPGLSTTNFKSQMTYTIDDLAEYRPSLAAGLRQLLDFDGDVESTYLWTFAVPVDRYGTVTYHSLCQGGEKKAVTNDNRQEFVSLYIRYLLDTAVSRQFEPFKRGFFTVCAGNALSLFRAEEIELLIRGSEEARIDVDALRAVAVYENFKHGNETLKSPAEVEKHFEVVGWFWEYFATAEPTDQRRLLQFITASDRVPATGAAGLVLRISMGGDGTGFGEGEERRYPVARTCFNLITLWGWKSKERLTEMLRGAVEGSEGFGLK